MKINKNTYEEEINQRLKRVLNDPELYPYCSKAYINANKKTGFEKSEEVGEFVLQILSGESSLTEKENLIWQKLKDYAVHGLPLKDQVKSIIQKRVQTMYSQIGDYILDTGTAADFGAGLGDFLRLVREKKPNLEIEGWDIGTDDAVGDVHVYDGIRIPREDKSYDQVWQTTVLHHFSDPVDGVKEISRLAKKRIILLETLPLGWFEDVSKDFDLTFVADYYYRLLFQSGEPVPGSYHTTDEWIKLFEEEGWKCINSEVFNNDIDFAEFSHTRIVLEQ